MILAFDTTAEFGSIALVDENRVVGETVLHAPEGFGAILFSEIEQLLSIHRIPLSQIDCFAAAAGPGSFTGIRVGLTAAKGLAEALGKPAVGVSNLQAMALHGVASLRATVLDARRGEVYASVYNSALEVVSPETVIRFADWLVRLPPGDLEFVARDFEPFRPLLSGTRFADVPIRLAPQALAGGIGHIAQLRLHLGEITDAAALDANYVRRSDAELFWK